MSNQRRGSWHAAGPSDRNDISVRRLINFLDEAAQELNDVDEDSAAFYFEQFAEYLRRDHKPGSSIDPAKVLGL